MLPRHWHCSISLGGSATDCTWVGGSLHTTHTGRRPITDEERGTAKRRTVSVPGVDRGWLSGWIYTLGRRTITEERRAAKLLSGGQYQCHCQDSQQSSGARKKSAARVGVVNTSTQSWWFQGGHCPPHPYLRTPMDGDVVYHNQSLGVVLTTSTWHHDIRLCTIFAHHFADLFDILLEMVWWRLK